MKGNLLLFSLIVLHQGTMLKNNVGISNTSVQVLLSVTRLISLKLPNEKGERWACIKNSGSSVSNDKIHYFENANMVSMQAFTIGIPLCLPVKGFLSFVLKPNGRTNITHTHPNSWEPYTVSPTSQVLNLTFQSTTLPSSLLIGFGIGCSSDI